MCEILYGGCMEQDQRDVTELLRVWAAGDRGVESALAKLVLPELKRIARRNFRRPVQQSLQPTELVNEAYLRLVNVHGLSWQDRAHFFAVAAQLMRRILVDHARAHLYQKRGGGAQRLELDEEIALAPERPAALVALDDALVELEKLDPRKARVIELRYFAGLSVEETAHVLGVSAETVMRDWRLARVWLLRQVSRGGTT